MKRLITIFAVAGLAGAVSQAFAQGGPGPGGRPDDSEWGQVRSNYYAWGTNFNALKNQSAPKAYSNRLAHAYSAQAAAGGEGQVRGRFGRPDLPADVGEMVQQFQQERQQLMSQLKNASEEQRKLILQEMEQLRNQLREQVCKLREECQQQAEQMRNRFRNNRDRILEEGTGGEGTGKDR